MILLDENQNQIIHGSRFTDLIHGSLRFIDFIIVLFQARMLPQIQHSDGLLINNLKTRFTISSLELIKFLNV